MHERFAATWTVVRTDAVRVMNTYEFAVILKMPADQSIRELDNVADRLFESFAGDVTPAMFAGGYVAECTIEDASLESAIMHVLAGLRKAGLEAERIELQAQSLPAA